MKDLATFAQAVLVLPLMLAGCSRVPGKPLPGDEVLRPTAVLNFTTLYQQNCSGCHGADGQHGAAINLANPEYQALVDDATLRNTIANGVKGTLMPAFSQSAGGMLTDQQVDALVKGIRSRWAKPAQFTGVALPPYRADAAGDTTHGAQVYVTYCASCHGPANGPADGSVNHPAGRAGSVTDADYLTLVSDQALRTIVIAGRPDFGAPDWRGNVPGHPMSNQEIIDVVAWLASQRPAQQPIGTPDTSGQSATQTQSQTQPAAGRHGDRK